MQMFSSAGGVLLVVAMVPLAVVVACGLVVTKHWILAARGRVWDPRSGAVRWSSTAQAHLEARKRWLRIMAPASLATTVLLVGAALLNSPLARGA